MTNEQMVEEIRNGFSVTANMERLYMENLPLIRKFIRPYADCEPEEDLLQEAYFGLHDAVWRYEASENVRFMTYAAYWVCQRARRYVESCGSVIRLPENYRQKISRYRKSVDEYRKTYGRMPTDIDMAAFANIPIEEIQRIRLHMAEVQSLDAPLQEDGTFCLADTLQSGFDLEGSVTDRLYGECQRKELWGIVGRYTDGRQQDVIRRHFQEGKSIAEIARESGQSFHEVRARKEIMEKLEGLGAKVYRTGMRQFKEHDCTSVVEYLAIRRMEAEEWHRRAAGN